MRCKKCMNFFPCLAEFYCAHVERSSRPTLQFFASWLHKPKLYAHTGSVQWALLQFPCALWFYLTACWLLLLLFLLIKTSKYLRAIKCRNDFDQFALLVFSLKPGNINVSHVLLDYRNLQGLYLCCRHVVNLVACRHEECKKRACCCLQD